MEMEIEPRGCTVALVRGAAVMVALIGVAAAATVMEDDARYMLVALIMFIASSVFWRKAATL